MTGQDLTFREAVLAGRWVLTRYNAGMHAPPAWLTMAACAAAAVVLLVAIFRPRSRVSALWLLVLLTLLAIAFAIGRWRQGSIDRLPPESKAVAE